MNETSPELSLTRTLGYSVGQIAGQVFRDLPSVLLLFFLTNVLGISPAVAGTAIFVPKLFVGIVADLSVGYISQKNPRAWPKWLAAGVVLAPLAMFMLFRIPEAEQSIQITYVVAIFSFYMAVFGAFSVPYLAIASKLATNTVDSTKLMAWRLVFTAVGVLIASGLSPWFLAQNGSLQPETAMAAYQKLGIMLSVVCGVGLLIAWLTSRSAPAFQSQQADSATVENPTVKAMINALKSKRFAPLVTANLVQLTGAGMAYAAFLYFLMYNMRIADPFSYIPKLIIISSIGIILAQPVWVKLAALYSKKSLFLISSFMYAAVMSFWAITSGISADFAYVLAFLMGVSNSGWAMLGFSMVTDISADGDGGAYSAGWISVDKIGFAFGGTLLIGLILSFFGFDSATAAMGGEQSDAARTGIMIAFGIVPGLLVTLGGIIFWVWGTETESIQ